jgi:tetratricopeptide (TPR) repeat protein
MFPTTSLVLLVLVAQQVPRERPEQIVAAATRAVEGDGLPELRHEWSTALLRDSSDRAAALGLATLARLRYDYVDARREYARLLAREPGDQYSVYARLGLAECDRLERSLDSAAAGLTRAVADARRLRDSAMVVEGLVALAMVRARTDPPETALALLHLAGESVGDDRADLRSRLRCARAGILAQAGLPAPARREAQAGLALARRTGDLRLQAFCWRAFGDYLVLVLDDRASGAPFDSAEALYLRARDSVGLAETLVASAADNLSYFDDGAAKADLERALQASQATRDRLAEARARRLLSGLAYRVSDLVATTVQQTEADRILREQGDEVELATLRRFAGAVAISLGQVDRADTLLREALAAAQRLSIVEVESRARTGLAGVAGARGDWRTARLAMDSALHFMRTHGLPAFVDGQRYNRGVIALRLGDLDSAEIHFRTYLRPGHPEGRFARYVARSRLAEIRVRRGDLPSALAEITGASEELDSLRAGLSDDELRPLVFQTGSRLDEADYGLATIVAALVHGGLASQGLELAERRRARELEDRLLRARFLESDSSDGAARDAVLAHRPSVGDLRFDRNTTAIEYLTGRGGQPTTIFVQSRTGLAARILPPIDSLAGDVDRFVTLLQHGGSAGFVGRRLRQALLDSALATLPEGVTRLVIVPDDVLHRVPFDALPLDDGTPLVRRFEVGLAPSLAVLHHLRSRPPGTGEPRILALADPRLAREVRVGDGRAQARRSAFEESGGLPRLAAAAAEADRVSQYGVHAIVRTGEAASEAFLKQRSLESFRVLHFATHALVDESTPARTALALAPGGGEDGFLGPGEIARLRIPADLVVLSACRTAGGVLVGGEGVQGLTAPLLQAGARSVVATLWQIPDRQTGDIVEGLYRGLAEGLPVSSALRRAKLEAIERGAPAAEWAAFTLVGDPLVRLPLRRPGRSRALAAGVIALAVAGVFGYRMAKRPKAAAD